MTEPNPPLALENIDPIVRRLREGRPAFFLDYDGTLTPIVDRPEDAIIGESMRAVIRRLAQRYPVAVVSGRDLADVRDRVGLESIFYAGSHGFDIVGPQGVRHQHPQARERLPEIDAAETLLRARIGTLPGALLERKTFSLAVHYRLVSGDDFPHIEAAVEEARAAHPKLRVQAGKKVFDFQPAVPWDKGRAVLWLMQAIDAATGGGESGATRSAGTSPAGPPLIPLYVGDDVTDEDAFAALAESGITVAVLDHPRPTRARLALRSTDEVERLLAAIADGLAMEARQ